MQTYGLLLFIIIYNSLLYNSIGESVRKECKAKLIPNTESVVCVCDKTYCDNFPALTLQKSGFAAVFETNRNGDRFKETSLKFEKTSVNSTNSLKKQTIKVDLTQKFQNIIGFGGAFTDSTGINIHSLPEDLGKNIINDYFSPNGIEYSMARTPIGGSDFSIRAYTLDDYTDDQYMNFFSLQKEDLEFKIPYMKLAQNVSKHEIKIFGSPWSPPVWMKTNGNFKSGSLKGPAGGKYYQFFAEYLVKFIKEYESHGVNIWGITVENEPVEGQDPKQGINGLSLFPDQERDFVKLNLGPTLVNAGFNSSKVKLMIFDENTPQILNWTDIILNDKDAAKYVSGIAIHWYINSNSTASVLDTIHKKYSEYFILNTEASLALAYGNWEWAEKYAFDIIRDLNHWVNGWVDWNMALNMEGGPSWVAGDQLSSPIYVNSSAQEYQKEPIFYIMGQFSKFLPPNSVRVGLELHSNLDKLYSTAFVRPDNQIVVIVFNMNNEEIELNINDPKNGYLNSKIMAHSIQSYIWSK